MEFNLKTLKSPNNETRITLYPVRRKSQGIGSGSIEALGVPDFEPEKKNEVSDNVVGDDSSLDIRSDFSQSPVKALRKRTKFGRNAQTSIMRIGGAFDRMDSNPSNYVFLTGTIPGGTHEAFSAVAEESASIAKSLADWFARTAKSDYWFYVWELQKRGALHIHYCIHPNNSNEAEKVLIQWKPKWEDVLSEVSRRTGADMWLREDGTYHVQGKSVLQAYAQRVRVSVAAYMSGYCSNGKNKHSNDANSIYFPSRWWGCSRKTVALVRSMTESKVENFRNYREAKIAFDASTIYFDEDSVKSGKWRHNVGAGETAVMYHTKEKQDELWESQKTMQITRVSHPNAWSMITLMIRISLTHMELMEKLQLYRSLSCTAQADSLGDSLYLNLLRRGCWRDCQIAAIERLFVVLPSPLSCPPSLELQLMNVKTLSFIHSKNYQSIKYNKYGYLSIHRDLPYPVDLVSENL